VGRWVFPWRRLRRSEYQRCDELCCFFLHRRYDVAVGIQGDCHCAVSKALRDDAGMNARLECESRMRVSKIVEAYTRESSEVLKRLEPPSETIGMDRQSSGTAEHEAHLINS
jgi:hypothetical protein